MPNMKEQMQLGREGKKVELDDPAENLKKVANSADKVLALRRGKLS